MPKKEKKGGGAGGRTEDTVYEQPRAEVGKELYRKKEEELARFLQDKLRKEQTNSAVNSLKLSDSWRTILRQSRAAELRSDVSVLSQSFERRRDGLDDVIQSLERELLEAERQAAQVNSLHLRSLEWLCAQLDEWQRFVQEQWDQSLQQLSARIQSEREQMVATSEQLRADVDETVSLLEKEFEETMSEVHKMFQDSVAVYKRALGNTGNTKLVRENKEALQENKQRNQQARKDLKQRTRELNDELVKNQVFIQNAESHAKKFKKQQTGRTDQEARERHLSGTGKEAIRMTQALRNQLTQAQTAAGGRFSDVTVDSSVATKTLQQVMDKGGKLLRFADMCRTLEQENASTPAPAATEEPQLERVQFLELQQLMRRVDAARLQQEVLKKHGWELSRENQQLRLLLRRRLDVMTLGDGLDGTQALLTVHQAPARQNPAEPSRRGTVVEATHAAKHSLMH